MHHRLAVGIGQARMDVLVCSNAVRIMLVWEGTDKDGIRVSMEGNHDVLVSTLRSRVEASRVIREYFVQWDGKNVDGVGWGSGESLPVG